ncbi:hypothetical protein QTH57_14710 [Clostridium perfringens]|nr:hypothetical protein [Clostridium perfringens]
MKKVGCGLVSSIVLLNLIAGGLSIDRDLNASINLSRYKLA